MKNKKWREKKQSSIPDEFRMIGTMNDYDKNLLLNRTYLMVLSQDLHL